MKGQKCLVTQPDLFHNNNIFAYALSKEQETKMVPYSTIKKHSISTTALIALAIYLMVFLVFFSGISSSGTMELFLSLVVIAVGWTRYKMIKTIPILIFVSFVMSMLIMSGKMGATGFNAPIKHALKFVHLLFAYVCFLFLQHGAGEKERRSFVCIALTASVATSIHSIILVMSGNVYAIRYASRYGYDTEGVASFSHIYGMPVLIVIVASILLLGRRMKLWEKAVLLAMLLLFLYFVYVSLMTTALILTVAGICLYILLEIMKNKKTIAASVILLCIIIAVLIILVFPERTMNVVLETTENLNYVLRDRIRFVAGKILQIPVNMTYSYNRRSELANYSIESFLNHPLFGVGYSGYEYGTIGCHQEWADMLGVFGLVGSSFVIGIIGYIFRSVHITLATDSEKNLFITLTCMFIVLGFLNPCMGGPMLIATIAISPNVKYILR